MFIPLKNPVMCWRRLATYKHVVGTLREKKSEKLKKREKESKRTG